MGVRFDLPDAGAAAAPAFANARACGEWLQALPLTNAATAQAQLRAQIAALAGADLKPLVLSDILETLREPVLFVQAEMARKFCFRPLPLADLEAGACTATMALWHGFAQALTLCVQALLDGERDLRGEAARVCQRALDAQSRMLIDALNAGLAIPADDWRTLHLMYRAAEEAGVAAEKVADPLNRAGGATRPMAAYVRAVLFSLGLPGDWGARQVQAAMHWTERWATRVPVTGSAPAKPTKPPVLVDLDSGRGGFRPYADGVSVEGGEIRHLDISALALSLRKRIHLLRKGEAPASLGLGEDAATLPALEQTLIGLYRHWGDGRAGREHARRPSSARALAAVGLAGIHFHVGGKPFRQPQSGVDLTTRQIREIATFGRAAREEADHTPTQVFGLEEWALQDESVAGLRLVRAAGAGARLAPGHLIAVRPTDARAFMVGAVRWAQMLAGGELMIGVRVLPGVPQAVALRPADPGAAGEKYQPGLVLPPVAALQLEASMLLPSGWFKPGRAIEVHGGALPRVTLATLIDRGPDFDRCAFQPG